MFGGLDAVLVSVCIALCFLNLVYGLLLLACTVPRLVVGACVVTWRGSVVRLYTKISFHRTDLLRRFANSTQNPYLALWIALSYLSAFCLVVLALLIGVVIGTISFGSGFFDGVSAVAVSLFTLAIAAYLVVTEQAMYMFCVISVVDGVLDSQDELRVSFIKVSAMLHRKRTEEMFNAKDRNRNNGLLGRDGRFVHNTQSAGRHKAPNRKDN